MAEHATRRWVRVPTPGENLELVRRAQAGDLAARNECIERNMPLVVRLAARNAPPGMREDCEQEGALALADAIERFEPSRGVGFVTFAWWRVLAAVQFHASRHRRHRGLGNRDFRAPDRPCEVEAADEAEAVRRRVARLDRRGREILARRFGIGCEQQRLRDVGAALGISYEAVRQAETKLFRKLRREFAAGAR